MKSNLKYGLSEIVANDVVAVFESNAKISSVILFGSRAKGTYYPGSDIDLALKGDNLNLNDILEASIQLEELLLAFKFDLLIYDRIKEEALRKHIDTSGKILFEREGVVEKNIRLN
jgi:predicted nucleotidyltransferase